MPKVYVRLARDARDTSTFKHTIVRDLSCISFLYIHITIHAVYLQRYIRCPPFLAEFDEFSSMTIYVASNVLKRIHPWLFRIESPLRGILSNLSAFPDHRPTIEYETFILVKRIRAHPSRSPSEKRLVMFFNVSTGNTTPNIDVSQGRGDLTGSRSPHSRPVYKTRRRVQSFPLPPPFSSPRRCLPIPLAREAKKISWRRVRSREEERKRAREREAVLKCSFQRSPEIPLNRFESGVLNDRDGEESECTS